MTDRTPASPVEDGLYEQVMTDPLVMAWRAFSDRFMDPAYRNDPKRMHIREAFAAGWDAALQAQDYTITKGGLDVERLGRAMNNVLSWVDGFEPSEAARTLADEYAALEPTHD